MRQDINILWLDDELSSSAHEERKEIVSGILEDKGYRAVVKECSTFVEAEKELSSVKRYDFFISDFNLDNKETGLTYLEKIREVNGYKQFVILYSNNEYSTIKREIIEVVKEKRINIFSNFTFFSAGDSNEENHFQEAIDVILCRWDELNAIRGRFMCENAEIEHLLREKLLDNNLDHSYRKLFDDFFREKVRLGRPNLSFRKKQEYESLKDKWSNLIEKRNSLAHVEEGFSDQEGFYIRSLKKPEIVIKESNLDSERRDLLSLKKEIIDFLNKAYY
ncbi:hypothetical protein HO483_05290 [Streptococcus suis]|uniref:hypothetical protein n=1 Tax=Streptococcus parasuis TaxID=1501662 RepID=UPI001554A98E|nr:hypothetical protein [Streptococcus suis]WNF87312.1 hypothetical protein RJW51_04180 [Streptococcus parasuis]